ncbi:MAG: isoprenylcysteine carboxylmethyltransferase family protein [Planctomycetota bacterium]
MTREMWGSYLLLAFVLMPALFRVRYGFSPVIVGDPRRDVYARWEWGYGGCVAVFTIALFALPVTGGSTIGGTAVLLSILLVLYASVAMGRSWRIGQREDDEHATFVRTGLYRWVAHPIYIGLVGLGIGTVLMLGVDDWCGWFLLITTLVYVVVQGHREQVRWQTG